MRPRNRQLLTGSRLSHLIDAFDDLEPDRGAVRRNYWILRILFTRSFKHAFAIELVDLIVVVSSLTQLKKRLVRAD